ncbi:hypothetical protein [Halogranum gelatinilyticum]|nr:hypothetical protein [Halogranum gelatinilyticum]
MFSPNADGECRFNPDDPPADTRANLDALAATQESSSEQYTTAMSNRLEDTRAQAMMQAKQTIIMSMNDGDNATVAKEKATNTVEAYYATIQENMLNRFETDMQAAMYMKNVSDANSATWLRVSTAGGDNMYTESFREDNHTLVDGSEVTTHLYVTSKPDYTYKIMPLNSNPVSSPAANAWNDYMGDPSPDYRAYKPVRYVNSTGTEKVVVDTQGYADVWHEIVQQSEWAKSNTDTLATEIYNQYNAGELNVSDLYDPFTIGVQSATAYNSTGAYSFAAYQMAALGYSGNLTASHTIEVYNSTGGTIETLDGTLYYTADDLSTLENNVTYTLADYSGRFVMAVQPADSNQSAYIQDLDEISGATSFEITSAVNTKTGESVSNTTIVKHVYETTDVSNLEEQIDQLTKLYEEQQEAQSSGGGASSGWTSNKIVVALVAVAAIAVYANKDS